MAQWDSALRGPLHARPWLVQLFAKMEVASVAMRVTKRKGFPSQLYKKVDSIVDRSCCRQERPPRDAMHTTHRMDDIHNHIVTQKLTAVTVECCGWVQCNYQFQEPPPFHSQAAVVG